MDDSTHAHGEPRDSGEPPADADHLFATPQHPYTRALVSASPAPGRRSTERIVLTGDPPNPAARPRGWSLDRDPYLSAWTNIQAALGAAPVLDRERLQGLCVELDARIAALPLAASQ